MTENATRQIGEVQGRDGESIAVGIDRGEVLLSFGGWMSADMITLNAEQADEFGKLYLMACWQAAYEAPLPGEQAKGAGQ